MPLERASAPLPAPLAWLQVRPPSVDLKTPVPAATRTTLGLVGRTAIPCTSSIGRFPLMPGQLVPPLLVRRRVGPPRYATSTLVGSKAMLVLWNHWSESPGSVAPWSVQLAPPSVDL